MQHDLENLAIASAGDVMTIYKAFRSHRSVFPHVRSDHIQRACDDGRCIYDSGVVIIWQRYVKSIRLGNVRIPRGSAIVHQILNAADQRGTAVNVFRRFSEAVRDPIYLTVRESNTRARHFYEKVGMKPIGCIAWDDGKIPGVIYCLGEHI
jgi:hypothetical protein